MSRKDMGSRAGIGLALLFLLAGATARLNAIPRPAGDQAATSKKKGPQAKSKEEYNAFLAAVSAPSASLAESSAREFEAKYPNSELLSSVYEQVMGKYQAAENSGKIVDMGRKALHYNPDNPIALVMTSTAIIADTRDTDIDRDQKLKETADDANRALQVVESGNFVLRADATPEQIAAFKDTVICMATGALGESELLRNNFAAAAQQLQRSLATQRGSSDAGNWLRLAQAEEGERKYSDALNAANKAATLAPPNSALATAATAAQARLKQLAAKTQ